MRIGNPLPVSLPRESIKATRIFKSFVNSSSGIDGLIPSHVLRSAYGFAIFTIAKAGFLMSVRAGTGLVVARLPDGQWSPPSAIGIGGMGFGGQVGAEVAEFILVLNSKSAVTQFMSAGSITLGGNLSVALGPIGRNAEGSGALNSKGKIAAMYSYSKTKGAFAGISVEGSAILERQDCNVKAYGSKATPTEILSGNIDMPPWATDLARVLTVCAGSYTEYVDRNLPSQLARNPSFEIDNHRESSSNTNPFITTGNSIFSSPKPDLLDPSNFSSPPPSETYMFGTSYASRSSVPPPKSQTKKSMFAVSSWRLNSRQNSSKSTPSTPKRQNTPPSHWIDNIRSDSPRSSQDRLNPLNPFHLSLSNDNPKPISQEKKSYDEGKQGLKTDDDIRSLSSIGSDDDDQGGQLYDWSNSNQRDLGQVAGIGLELNKTDPFRRNWFDSIESTHHVMGKSKALEDGKNLEGGMIDDLISFDRIGPPSSIACLSNSISSSDSYNIGASHSSTIEQDDFSHDGWDSKPNLLGEDERKSNKLNLELDSHEQDEVNGKDFLVGTQMPSVFRTKTELAGYLGKVVAKFDFFSDQAGDLSFKKGDVILIVNKIDDQWWLGAIGLRRGIFPVNRVSHFTQ